MAGSSKGILAFIAVGGVLAAALVSGYLLYWEPRRTVERTRAEVREFSATWQKTRECFVGSSPTTSNLYEAMMIREMTRADIVSDLAACTDRVRETTRPGEFDSESEALEAAWTQIKKARSTLASALAHRIAKRTVRPPRELRRLLAEALAGAEDAHRALLEAADEPDPLASLEPLPSPELVPLHADLGTKPVLADLYVKNNRVLAIAETDGKRTLYALSREGAKITPLVAGVFVGSGDLGWGVENIEGELRIRQLRDQAAPQPARGAGKLADGMRVLGAIGNERGGRMLVLWNPSSRGPATIRRSTGPDVPFTTETISLGDDDDSTFLTSTTDLLFERLILSGQGTTLEWRSDLAPPQRYAFEGDPCLSANASWWFNGESLVHNTGGTTGVVARSEDMPWRRHSCSDTQLIGLYYAYPPTADVRLCNRTSCPASMKLPVAVDTQLIPLLGPSGPVVVAISADVLLVWSPDKDGKGLRPGRAVRLEGGTEVIGVLEWSGGLGAVVRSGNETVIAKIPR